MIELQPKRIGVVHSNDHLYKSLVKPLANWVSPAERIAVGDGEIINVGPNRYRAVILQEGIPATVHEGTPLYIIGPDIPREDQQKHAAALIRGSVHGYSPETENPYVIAFFIRAMLRGYELARKKSEFIEVGDLRLDLGGRAVLYKGKPVKMPAIEFKLLKVLVLDPEVVFSSEELLDAVWPDNHEIDIGIVSNYMSRIRRKTSKGLIKNHWGFGYSLSTE